MPQNQRTGGTGRTALTSEPRPALILRWGALDEGKNQASDMGFDGRGTASEKFYWRPVAPTQLDERPFGGSSQIVTSELDSSCVKSAGGVCSSCHQSVVGKIRPSSS